MISKQTAYDIAVAYEAIEHANKLLADVEKVLSRSDRGEIRDAFGRRADGLQLGVPSGERSHQLFNVPWELAKPVLRAYIATKESELEALNLQARAEARGES